MPKNDFKEELTDIKVLISSVATKQDYLKEKLDETHRIVLKHLDDDVGKRDQVLSNTRFRRSATWSLRALYVGGIAIVSKMAFWK